MNETQRRIKAYKEALPGLRERVIAVALLLAMSAAMMTSASFAWLTISRRPEVTGVNTTVAANGNLEIALVSPDGNRPEESKIGDSSATKGQSIAASNITWGNLINLGDPSYGLDNLTLRPAQLNKASLLNSPLYGAVYGLDGRIKELSSDFGYATWNLPDGDTPGYFGVSDSYGVRAISSTTTDAVSAPAIYLNMVSTANNKNLAAGNMYVSLGKNERYMPSLATMMGLYMTARMNPSHETLKNPAVDIADIQNLRDMYADFLSCFDAEADAMAALVNLQLFLKHGDGNYTPYTAADIYKETNATLKAKGLTITDLDQFKKDRNIIETDLEKLKEICTSGQNLTWKDTGLNDIVNHLVDVGKCTIGKDNTPISSIGASNALSYLSGTQEARITNGILYRFEERTGGYIEVKNLAIKATINRNIIGTQSATVKANIQTTAPRDYNLFNNDLDYTKANKPPSFAGGIPVAEDTYGLAIDLWVRTNAAGSYLTLEGNVLTESHTVRATSTDANGNTVELFTVVLSSQDEEGNELVFSIDLYQGKTTVTNEEDGTTSEVDAWFQADNHSIVSEEELGGKEPTPKMTEVVTVIGFEGENRVWDKDKLQNIDATTQGSGSCYVYYADTPEDQARSLRLLEAFNVAFVNDEGKMLASAVMDTEHYYALSGRVIVPLVLDSSDSIDLGEDAHGNTTYGITALEKNVPTRITAIVYLDGTKLSNQEVLAASDIQGQLNIQFGSSAPLDSLSNEALENAVRKVSASLSKSEFDYDTATEPMTTQVTVHVEGEQPNQVTAFFLRSINASQGSREETMTFTQQDNGEWVTDYTFTAPGTYILRTVRLDGVDYDLTSEEGTPLPKVVVTGFAVEYLRCTKANAENHVTIMSAANSSSVDLAMKFVADNPDKLPRTVAGRYIREEDGSAVNIAFTLDPTTQVWSGSATFLTSGKYQLQYLVLDGEYTELAPAFWQTANVTLGMRVAAYTTSPQSFKYVPSEMNPNEKLLAMQIMIVDNAGNQMRGLAGVKLVYSMRGSGAKTMDADLTWNGSYYVGELTTTGPGIWQFSSVTVNNNVLTYATQSPTFTILSPEPPEYYAHRTPTYQLNLDNNAMMDAQITNSAAASVQAYIVKAGETEGRWVTGSVGAEITTEDGKNANHWNFPVPKDANGYQDGNWQITELRMWDVFAADGTPYTEEAPLVIDVSDTQNKTKVVARIHVNFAENNSADFGKDSSGKVTGDFMDSYTVSGLYVDIRDFEGKPIDGVQNVKLSFVFQNDSLTYGGYTSAQLTNANADFTIALSNDGSGTHFAQTENKTLQFAGSYKTTFSFDVARSGQNALYVSYSNADTPKYIVQTGSVPKYSVSSVAPKVVITEASYASASSKTAAAFTDNSTTVYAYQYETTSTVCGQTFRYKAYNQPFVTITLSGYGNAASATVTFTAASGDTLLYEQEEGRTAVNKFTWSGNGTCKRWVGYWNSQTGDDDRTTAGTLTATTLVLVYNGVEYTVSAPITIQNPN